MPHVTLYSVFYLWRDTADLTENDSYKLCFFFWAFRLIFHPQHKRTEKRNAHIFSMTLVCKRAASQEIHLWKKNYSEHFAEEWPCLLGVPHSDMQKWRSGLPYCGRTKDDFRSSKDLALQCLHSFSLLFSFLPHFMNQFVFSCSYVFHWKEKFLLSVDTFSTQSAVLWEAGVYVLVPHRFLL